MVNIKINNYFVRFIFIKREVKNFDNKNWYIGIKNKLLLKKKKNGERDRGRKG